MKIVVVGASGTIGKAVYAALAPRHEVIGVSRSSGDIRADITDVASIEALFARTGPVDAVINAAGGAAYKPFTELTEADFASSFADKLMGQINLTRLAIPHLRDNGSITLTAGWWAREPVPNVVAIATVNAALEGFTRAVAIELPRGLRINLVSPPLVGTPEFENGKVMRMSPGDAARGYVDAVEGRDTGTIVDTRPFASH